MPQPVGRFPGSGRPFPDQQVLCGISYVLHAATEGEFLPQEPGSTERCIAFRLVTLVNSSPAAHGCAGERPHACHSFVAT
jgi:hypothetical protein